MLQPIFIGQKKESRGLPGDRGFQAFPLAGQLLLSDFTLGGGPGSSSAQRRILAGVADLENETGSRVPRSLPSAQRSRVCSLKLRVPRLAPGASGTQFGRQTEEQSALK